MGVEDLIGVERRDNVDAAEADVSPAVAPVLDSDGVSERSDEPLELRLRCDAKLRPLLEGIGDRESLDGDVSRDDVREL